MTALVGKKTDQTLIKIAEFNINNIHLKSIIYSSFLHEGDSRFRDELPEEEIREIREIDELETFVGRKKNKFWMRSKAGANK